MFGKILGIRPKAKPTYRGEVVGAPASDSDLAAAEEALGCVFPDQIRDLYKSHDGVNTEGDPARTPGFMPLDLVVNMHTPSFSSGAVATWIRFGLVAFWEDYESNYYAVRVAGPGQGLVTFIQHDDASFAPRFRTIDSYLDRMNSAATDGKEGYEWDIDYPLPDIVNDREVSARKFFWQQADACEDEDSFNWFEMGANLVSKHEVGLLVPYLDSSDYQVQSTATDLIARAAQPDAIEHMKRMVLEGGGYARRIAIRGITQLVGIDGLKVLDSLASDALPEIQKNIRQHVKYIRKSIKRGLDPFKDQSR